MSIFKRFQVVYLSLSLFAMISLFAFAGCGQKQESAKKDGPVEKFEPAIEKPALEKDEGMGSSGSEELALQTTCPVMKNPINKELYVDHEGKRIYVCCKACIGKVESDPEKYIEKLEEMGQKPYPVNQDQLKKD